MAELRWDTIGEKYEKLKDCVIGWATAMIEEKTKGKTDEETEKKAVDKEGDAVMVVWKVEPSLANECHRYVGVGGDAHCIGGYGGFNYCMF